MSDLLKELHEPTLERMTPRKANAYLLGLCQDAANEIDKRGGIVRKLRALLRAKSGEAKAANAARREVQEQLERYKVDNTRLHHELDRLRVFARGA